MSTIKYTTDGKKVSVVGKLNSQETIVQEVFIKEDGSEIPAGENFVVKSLVDHPVVSWKEKQIKVLEERYNKLQPEYERKIDELRKQLSQESEILSKRIRSTIEQNKFISPEKLEEVVMFLSGQTKWIVTESYNSLELLPFDKSVGRIDSWSDISIRLCSIYGRSNGDLRYAIHDYSDYSGGKKFIYPFSSEDAALSFLKKKVYELFEDSPNDELVKSAEKYNVELNPETVKKLNEKNIKLLQGTLDNLTDQSLKIQEAIKAIKAKQNTPPPKPTL